MAPTDRRPSTLAPSPNHSIAPILSIFTLRPRSVTLKPSVRPAVRSRRTAVLVALLALSGLGLLGWRLARPPAPDPALPAVFVNGAPKEKTTDRGKPERWANAPVTVKLDASLAKLGAGASAAVQAGFGAWLETDASLPPLAFDTTSGAKPSLEPDGVNAVMLAPIELSGHKKDLALTISFVDAETGRILESDIVINAKKPLEILGEGASSHHAGSDDDADGFDAHEAPGCDGTYDLQSVVAHEAGHFFGLGEDHEDPATTMFYKTGKCELHKRDLEPPDRTVMVRLYQQPAPESAAADTGGGCGGARVARGEAPAGQAALVLALVALAWGRRRRLEP